MTEKIFYGSNGRFKGSMDDDGHIYDERHRLMGYVKDGTVYDTCNIPHGRITDSGMVRDNSFHEVGQEYGTGFSSRGPRRELGRVRADTLRHLAATSAAAPRGGRIWYTIPQGDKRRWNDRRCRRTSW